MVLSEFPATSKNPFRLTDIYDVVKLTAKPDVSLMFITSCADKANVYTRNGNTATPLP